MNFPTIMPADTVASADATQKSIDRAGKVFDVSLLVLIHPLLWYGGILFLSLIGWCTGEVTVTHSSTMQCSLLPLELVIEQMSGLLFVWSFLVGIVLIPTFFVVVVSMVIKTYLMWRRKQKTNVWIKKRSDILFLIITALISVLLLTHIFLLLFRASYQGSVV